MINKIYVFSLFLTALLLSNNVFGANKLNSLTHCNIIPLPQKATFTDGNFQLNNRTTILFQDNDMDFLSLYLKNELKYKSEISIRKANCKVSKTYKNSIQLQLEEGFSDEAYKIEINSGKITCKASTKAGLFYAVQSLLQSIRLENNKWVIPCMSIEDSPRFAWRGFMLDESRHFFGKKVVIEYLEIMGKLKLNRFHWHLSDEQGWRIEIKKYPLLTQIGSIGCWDDSKADAAFYTQEDIKEIVEFASQRNIMIIPEIDMPGHATAITRSYPELSGGGTGRWNGFTFHPTKETTYEFIDNLFAEIITLFPAPYIHIGGDEVHYGNQSWYSDSIIQNFIKKQNLTNEVGLEHYFVKRVNKIIQSKGKIMLGWDEITNVGLNPKEVAMMWWRQDKPELLSSALKNGFTVILTPRLPCYFDFVQDETHDIGRKASEGHINDFSAVYQFPEIPIYVKDITSGHENQISGIQANLWTERIKDKKRLDYMIFPRLIALAEAAWTKPERKSLSDFENRLQLFMQYLKSLNIYYFDTFNKDETPEPWGPSNADVISEG